MLYKNVASQKIAVFAYTASTGAAKTGDAAQITAYISKDFAAGAATNDVNPTEMDATNMPGWYVFDLTQAETNAEVIVLAPKSSTSGVVLDQAQVFTQDAAISSRASQTSVDDVPTVVEFEARTLVAASYATAAALDAVDNYVDTEIAAIKAKTDNLPSDPADQSAVEAAITAATSALATAANLATLAGYVDTEVAAILAAVDTEVAAIKAKTDNLPASPAAVGSAMTLTAAYDAAKTAATQASVDDLPTNAELATALAGADDAVLAAVAALNNLSSAQAQTAAAAALTAYDPPTNAEMEARTLVAANYATAAALDAVDNYVDTEVAAIKAVTDKLDTALVLDGAVYQLTANALELAPTGGSAPSAATIASAVRTELATELGRINVPIDSRLAPATAGRTLDVDASGNAAANVTHHAGVAVAAADADGNVPVIVKAWYDTLVPEPYTAGYPDIGTVTNISLQVSQQVRDAMKLAPTAGAPAAGSVDKHLDDLLTTIGSEIVEGTYTRDDILRIIAAALAGETSGSGTATVEILGLDGATTRITATLDGNGNRTSMTLDGT